MNDKEVTEKYLAEAKHLYSNTQLNIGRYKRILTKMKNDRCEDLLSDRAIKKLETKLANSIKQAESLLVAIHMFDPEYTYKEE